jgi:hypothetical protein
MDRDQVNVSGKCGKSKIGHALQKKPRSRWEAAGGASLGGDCAVLKATVRLIATTFLGSKG